MMDQQAREWWARIAMFAIPVAMIVGCRVGLRACVGFDRQGQAERRVERGSEDPRARAADGGDAAADAHADGR